jgi:UDP-N-acetylmuramate dehydrogenase
MALPSPPSFVRADEDLAVHTTIGLGGKARLYAQCETRDQVVTALAFARTAGIPTHILSGGSNTIFADEGFDGLVIAIGLKGVMWELEGREARVTVRAGEWWDHLVADAIQRGCGGIECLSGIPGSVGATPIQNVGAYGQEVGESITTVRAVDRQTLKTVQFTGDECGFTYRNSRFKGDDRDAFVIIDVTFQLRAGGTADLRYGDLANALSANIPVSQLRPGQEVLTAVRGAVLNLRRSKSMVIDPADPDSRSVGSFFMNPQLTQQEFGTLVDVWKKIGDGSRVAGYAFPGGMKVPAGWLVEHAGFEKGFTRNGVGISRSHALALVNRGGTTNALIDLAEEIRRRVREKFGIRLEYEPVVVPRGAGPQ